MTPKLGDKEHELIEEAGWIHSSLIIEVQGNDKKLADKAIHQMVERMKNEKDTRVYGADFSEVEQIKADWFSAHVEIFILTKNFGALTKIALLYAPSVVEIMDPNKINLEIGDAQNLLVDISGIVTRLIHTIYEQKGALAQAQKGESPKPPKES